VAIDWAYIVFVQLQSAVTLPDDYWANIAARLGKHVTHTIVDKVRALGGQQCYFAIGLHPETLDPSEEATRRVQHIVSLKLFTFYNITVTAGPTVFRKYRDGTMEPLP
jgi:hypothetical protein